MIDNKTTSSKVRERLIEKYGSEEKMREHFRMMGSIGGRISRNNCGFNLNPELAKKAGSKGGKRSRTGYKIIKEDDEYLYYRSKTTGNIMKVSK